MTGERFAGNEQRMTVTADPLEQVNAHSLLSAAKWRWSWDCTPRAKSDIYDCIVTFLIFLYLWNVCTHNVKVVISQKRYKTGHSYNKRLLGILMWLIEWH